jgi:hypothetical protein
MGDPMLDARIQQTVLKEYTLLRRSEKSLLFFINNVSQLTPTERALVRYLLDDKKLREIAEAACVWKWSPSRRRSKAVAQVRLHPHQGYRPHDPRTERGASV